MKHLSTCDTILTIIAVLFVGLICISLMDKIDNALNSIIIILMSFYIFVVLIGNLFKLEDLRKKKEDIKEYNDRQINHSTCLADLSECVECKYFNECINSCKYHE